MNEGGWNRTERSVNNYVGHQEKATEKSIMTHLSRRVFSSVEWILKFEELIPFGNHDDSC